MTFPDHTVLTTRDLARPVLSTQTSRPDALIPAEPTGTLTPKLPLGPPTSMATGVSAAHPVKIYYQDDADDPAKSISEVHQMASSNGLYTIKDNTLGGLAPALTFLPGKPNPVTCVFLYGVQNGKYAATYGDRTFCHSA